jgi:hypothetical protein
MGQRQFRLDKVAEPCPPLQEGRSPERARFAGGMPTFSAGTRFSSQITFASRQSIRMTARAMLPPKRAYTYDFDN